MAENQENKFINPILNFAQEQETKAYTVPKFEPYKAPARTPATYTPKVQAPSKEQGSIPVSAPTAETYTPPDLSINLLPDESLSTIFRARSIESGVPANILMAMAQQDSNYNASAVGAASPNGRSIGIMQYNPAMAETLGIDPFDQNQAISAAAMQFKTRLEHGYTLEEAIVAHKFGDDRKNWGPKADAYLQDVWYKSGAIYEQGASMHNAPHPTANNPEPAVSGLPQATTKKPFSKQDPGLMPMDQVTLGPKEAQSKFKELGQGRAEVQNQLGALIDGMKVKSDNLSAYRSQIESMGRALAKNKDKLTTQEQVDEHNKKVADYNNSLNDYQLLAKEYNQNLDDFNAQSEELQNKARMIDEEISAIQKAGEQADNADRSRRENNGANLFSDTLYLLNIGADRMALSFREGVRQVFGNDVVNAIDKIDEWGNGKSSEELFNWKIKNWEDQISQEMFDARKKDWVAKDDNGYAFGPAWGDWRSYASGVIESLPETAATMFPAGAMAKGAYFAEIAAGAGTKVAAKSAASTAAIAGGLMEGFMGGSGTAQEVRSNINAMNEDELKNSDAVKSMMDQGYTFEEARGYLASDAASQAFVLAGVMTGMFGGQGDKVLSNIFSGQISSRTKSALKSALAEGLLEEAPQSLGQAVASNFAMQSADPNIQLTEGALNQMAGGAVAGGIMGGGMGLAASTTKSREQVAKEMLESAVDSSRFAESADNVARSRLEPDWNLIDSAMPDARLDGQLSQPTGEAPTGPIGRAATETMQEQVISDVKGEDVHVVGDSGGSVSGKVVDYEEDGNGSFKATIETEEGEKVALDQDSPVKIVRDSALNEPVDYGDLDADLDAAIAAGDIAQIDNQGNLVQPELKEVEQVQEPVLPVATIQPAADAKTSTASTPSGKKIDVAYQVVDADQLITSNKNDGAVNELYPKELQPRDRSRAASISQINNISANISPELLGYSANTVDGAPIVSSDGIVESGNGRTNAIIKAYDENGQSAEAYKSWLSNQGYNIDGITKPILVRVRTSDMSPSERIDYVKSSNERTTLSMSLGEQALSDSKKINSIIDLYKGGDVNSAENRDFVRNYIKNVVGQGDVALMVDQNGLLSQDGRRRIQAAIMSTAYDDPTVVSEMFESNDTDIKSIGNALMDASGNWAQMRSAAKAGALAADIDPTANLMEAVSLIRKARSEGRSIADVISQNDMFSGDVNPMTESFVRIFFKGDNFRRPRSRKTVTEALNSYVENAMSTKPDAGLFGDEVNAQKIMESQYAKLEDKQQEGAGSNVKDIEQPSKQRGRSQSETVREAESEKPAAKTKSDAGFSLNAQTEKELADKALALKVAKEKEQADEKAISNKEKADREVNDFVLSGSDSVADIAESRGQGDLLSTPNKDNSKNTIFTEDAANKARELLRKKLGQMSSGLDPEIMQAGITLAGYHIEKGARSFSAYAKAMVADLGDMVKPYLKSWYMAAKYDPRTADFDGMDEAVAVDSADIEETLKEEPTNDKRPASNQESVSADGQGTSTKTDIGNDGRKQGRYETEEVSQEASEQSRPSESMDVSSASANRKPSNKPVDSPVSKLKADAAGSTDGERSIENSTGGLFSDKEPVSKPSPVIEKAPSKYPTLNKSAFKSMKAGDISQISEQMPFLSKGQVEDVSFIENRFSKPDGYGVLLTNGTGTGKTFSGLGAVKRIHASGKKNILIVVPKQTIADAWKKAGKKFFDLKINNLKDTKDAGEDIVVTTFANFGKNDAIYSREWDSFVMDEAQYLSSDEKGSSTDALVALRALTYKRNVARTRIEAQNRDEVNEMNSLYASAKLASGSDNEQEWPKGVADKKKAVAIEKRINALISAEAERIEAIKPEDKPRVLFLSATPFAYEKNVVWGNEFLYDWGDANGQGYNSGNGYQQFMMEHFGYRMRYNRLSQPDKNVDRNLMQRSFNKYLRNQKVLSSKLLDSDYDYDRRFILTSNSIGQKVDQALEWLRENSSGDNAIEGMRALSKQIDDTFDYRSRMYFLEALKARDSIPTIKANFDLGRKVLILHDLKKGGTVNPFIIKNPEENIEEAYNLFKSQFDSLIQDFEELQSPIDLLSQEFPDIAIYNGDVLAKDRLKIEADFNSDEPGSLMIMLAQGDAMREGVSIHDTTGKYPRVMLNLGMPGKPTAAIQQEGRTYRVGQASNAMFRYFTIGTNWERYAFASKIASRAATAENLALGDDARGLKESFISAYENARSNRPGFDGEGTGGKATDRSFVQTMTPWDQAKSYYYGTKKQGSGRAAMGREHSEFFATPEPVGLKMVQFADIKGGEEALEPSAGHGAIARWFPENSKNRAIELTDELASKLALRFNGNLMTGDFMSHNVINKYDAIVMNPPFGSGGKQAVEHVGKAIRHLRDGGRIVALIPTGPAADKKFNDLLFGDDAPKNIHLAATIIMPPSVFERAGTRVMTKIIVLDRQDNEEVAANIQNNEINLSSIESINDLFDVIQLTDIAPRTMAAEKTEIKSTVSSNVDAPSVEGIEGFETWETKHTKTDADLFMANAKNRVDKDKFKAMISIAKANNGDWSRFGKSGFLFYTAEDRKAFIDALSVEPKLSVYDESNVVESINAEENKKSVERTTNILKSSSIGPFVDELIKSGALNIIESAPSSLVYRLGQSSKLVSGYADNGKITIIADNVSKMTDEQLVNVVLHEGFHAVAPGVLGSKKWEALQSRLGRILDRLESKIKNGTYRASDEWTRGMVKLVNAMKRDPALSGDRATQIEEFGAYAIEYYKQAPAGIKEWVRNLIDMIKDFTFRNYGVQLGKLTEGQLRSMAISILKSSTSKSNNSIYKANSDNYDQRKSNKRLGIQDDLDSKVAKLASDLMDKLGLKTLNLNMTRKGDLKLDTIIVNKGDRKSGKGTKAMESIVDFADDNGLRTVLSAAIKDDFQGTTSRSRLVRFYKRFGFIENKGRNKDFEISESMIRNPKPVSRSSLSIQDSVDSDVLGPMEGRFDLPEETKGEALQRIMQDRFNRVSKALKVVKEQGGAVTEASDVYKAEERFHGRSTAKIENLMNDELKPFIAELAKADMTLDEIAEYSYAKHARERNAYIASINEKFTDGNGSGMSDAEADSILAAFDEKYGDKVKNLHKMLMDISKGTRDYLKREGLISAEEHQAWSEMFDHYVPLKGFENVDEYGLNEVKPSGRHNYKGFSVSGRESKAATGRQSKAAQLIENIVIQREQAIIRAEKNRVAKSMLRLVLDNPDPTLWAVNEVKTQPKIVGDNNKKAITDIFSDRPSNAPVKKGRQVKYVPVMNKYGDDVITVKQKGREILISIKDPILAEQMRMTTATSLPPGFSQLNIVNRALAQLWTALNPVFTVTNYSRDIQTAVINAMGEDSGGKKLASKTLKYSLPGGWAMQASVQHLRNKDTEGAEWYERYRQAGGKTGFYSFDTIEDKSKELSRMLKVAKGDRNKALIGKDFVVDVLMTANAVIENTPRLAAFRAGVESGMSDAEAASFAKNLTVNFNRRGEWTHFFGSLYLFFNPAVQGVMRMGQAITKSKRVQAAVTSMALGTFALAVMNRMLGGDDDDGEPYYDKIPNYVKMRNIVIMKPGGKGDYFKVPMPYGYSFFSSIGNSIYDFGFSNKSKTKISAELATAFGMSFNPVGDGAPTVLAPWIQLEMNKNFFGNTIMPPQPPYGSPVPDSQRYYPSMEGSWLQKATEAINDLSGGNETRPGLVDISPESIDHIFRSYMGGLGSSFSDILKVTTQDDTEITKLPFAKQVYGTQFQGRAINKFYENAQAADISAIEGDALRASKDKKEIAKWEEEHKWEARLDRRAKEVKKELSELRKEMRKVKAAAALAKDEKARIIKEIELKMEKIAVNFNREWNVQRELSKN